MPHPIAAENRLEGLDCQGWRLRHHVAPVYRTPLGIILAVGLARLIARHPLAASVRWPR